MFVDAPLLILPVGEDVVAGNPDEALATGNRGEMAGYLGENDERRAAGIGAHGEQLRVYGLLGVGNIGVIAVDRVEIGGVVDFVELLAIARLLVLGVGNRLRRRQRLEARGESRVVGGGFDEDAETAAGHGVEADALGRRTGAEELHHLAACVVHVGPGDVALVDEQNGGATLRSGRRGSAETGSGARLEKVRSGATSGEEEAATGAVEPEAGGGARIAAAEVADFLLAPVVVEFEVFSLQIGDGMAFLVVGDDAHVDQARRHLDGEGTMGIGSVRSVGGNIGMLLAAVMLISGMTGSAGGAGDGAGAEDGGMGEGAAAAACVSAGADGGACAAGDGDAAAEDGEGAVSGAGATAPGPGVSATAPSVRMRAVEPRR